MNLFYPLKGIGKTPGVYLTQGFGETLMDYSQYGWKGHNGIDWSAPLGTPVYAISDGWIIEATAKETGYGLRVTEYFEADGFQWVATYGHFQKINFPDIQWTQWDFDRRVNRVIAGQVLGYVNSSGNSTGNHLHLSLQKYKNNNLYEPNNGYGGAVNPLPFLKGEPKMSNVKLVNNKGEWGFLVPATTEDALIDKALNFGYPLATKEDGKKVDWGNIKADIVI